MTLDEALQFADQWTEGHTFYEGSQGWRVVCAVLAAEVKRLRASSEQLTLPEIAGLVDACKANVEGEFLVEFARAIEKCHGIGAGE